MTRRRHDIVTGLTVAIVLVVCVVYILWYLGQHEDRMKHDCLAYDGTPQLDADGHYLGCDYTNGTQP